MNPFQQFKVGSLWTNTRKRAITKEDIHKLIELDLSDRDFYTQLAKDIFLFSYFMAGINFKDIALLTYGDIENGRIYYARRKTGKMMNCCLTEQAQEIIDKYHTEIRRGLASRNQSVPCLSCSTKRSMRRSCCGILIDCGQCDTHWLQPMQWLACRSLGTERS